jgi:uncharacterized protein YoxC
VNADTLLVIFVGVSALAFVIQSISMLRTFQTVKGVVEKLNKQSQDLQREVREVVAKVNETAESLKPLGLMAQDVTDNLKTMTGTVRERAQDLDQFIQEMLQVGRDQAAKVDYVVTDTVQKFEQTTELIQRDVIKPAIELSAFLKGVKSGLDYLFTRKRSPSTPAEEEELFI